MLEHGGKLRRAAEQYRIPLEQWLDLSTGISPFTYGVPAIPQSFWQRLPEENDGLVDAARQYYGVDSILPVAGSQAAIQTIPRLIPRSRVGLFHPSYNEHAHAWQKNGHQVAVVTEENIDVKINELDALVVCNPNNPSGKLYAPDQIEGFCAKLDERGGMLVIDEAFMDATSEMSVIKQAQHRENLVVLRSLGKFFGLSGARIGFVAARKPFLDALQEEFGPWTVAGPCRYVAAQALNDSAWQERATAWLRERGSALRKALADSGFEPEGFTSYFCWLRHPEAEWLHDVLCRRGIFTRLFEQPASIRFGLCSDNEDLERLRDTLKTVGAALTPPLQKVWK